MLSDLVTWYLREHALADAPVPSKGQYTSDWAAS
jgi:hypothetical protein